MNIEKLDFEKAGGLIPAIIVDDLTGDVLMLGYMNKAALNKTISEKKVTFYSRSKERLWTKGESSGNYLNLVSIKEDCDKDALLIRVKPEGNTCHTGSYSCFEQPKDYTGFLSYLQKLTDDRKAEMPEDSYTTKLFQQGENRIIQKVGEEAIETVIAAKNNDKDELINEASDLLFHLTVLFTEKGISINDIAQKLYKRHNK